MALLTYSYATLRKYAAEKPDVYVGEEVILKGGSVTCQEIYGFVRDNIDILKNEKDFKGEDGDFAFKQLQALLNLNKSEDFKDDSVITIFNDKHDRHLCYGIGLNKVKERIVVSFRGTSSIFDIVDDVKVAGVDAENPLYRETPIQNRTMQIHKGFYSKYDIFQIRLLVAWLLVLPDSHFQNSTYNSTQTPYSEIKKME